MRCCCGALPGPSVTALTAAPLPLPVPGGSQPPSEASGSGGSCSSSSASTPLKPPTSSPAAGARPRSPPAAGGRGGEEAISSEPGVESEGADAACSCNARTLPGPQATALGKVCMLSLPSSAPVHQQQLATAHLPRRRPAPDFASWRAARLAARHPLPSLHPHAVPAAPAAPLPPPAAAIRSLPLLPVAPRRSCRSRWAPPQPQCHRCRDPCACRRAAAAAQGPRKRRSQVTHNCVLRVHN